MRAFKFILACMLAAMAVRLAGQTNKPAATAPEQRLFIDSKTGYFDGVTNQMVYLGNVFVTDHEKLKLRCERLTVDIPRNGEDPTNMVAETNVVVDVALGGQNYHITSAKAVYAFHVIGGVTNQTVTFTGGNPLPKLENEKMIQTGESFVFDIPSKRFYGGTNYHTILKPNPGSGGKTNGSPFDFLK